MAGRSNPPLFELIRQDKPRVRSAPPQPATGNPRHAPEPEPPQDHGSAGTALAEPPTIAETKPRPAEIPAPSAESAPRVEPAQANAAAVEQAREPAVPLRERFRLPKLKLPEIPDFQIPSRISDLKQSITMPVSRLWIGGILAAAALVAVVWISVSWAFQAGQQSQDLSPYLEEAGPIVMDPLTDPLAGPSGGRASRTPPQLQPGLPASMATNTGQPAASAPAVPAPRIPEDTRVVGNNYLQLTSFVERNEAFAAAAFLTEGGVPTIPVGMDTGRVDGNNREKYLLIALEGIPGDRFKALADRRAQIRRRVQELGRIWTKEHGGSHSFHDPQWAKHR